MHHQLEELNASLEGKVKERTATLEEAYLQLEEQNKILQELDQLKSDFVTLVSHELRTPLNNLGGGLELLLTRRKDSKTSQNTLGLMQAEVQRLTRFVENILNVSAVEAGRMTLQPAPLSVHKIFDEIKNQWAMQPESGRIEYNVPKSIPRVLADRDALVSVLNHLLDNAVKYAPQGSISLCARRNRSSLRLEVRDSGPGISDDKRGLLFERFQRLDAKDSQSVYGYGLGLYLSKRLLQSMGSELTYETSSDGGACFAFDLKVAKK
jgi:signal transduction histidine kinase